MAAFNARWAHTSFGARSLIANLGDLRDRAQLVEMTVTDRAVDIVEAVLGLDPTLVGFGVYVWNADLCATVVSMIKAVRPDLPIILGGPEVICRDDLPSWTSAADYVIAGEAEVEFRLLCTKIINGEESNLKFITADPPDLDDIELAYDLYQDEDISHRKIYVEASRGCPFGCKFCLSSLDERVRRIPTDRLLRALDSLWLRGVRHFKFVDRALHYSIGAEVLDFFLARFEDGAFLHFELVPDTLSPALAEMLARFPEGSVQLEVGIQTLDPEVSRRIGRHQNLEKVEKNLQFLLLRTGVHIHADLIVGLPGESMAGFAAGFDRLLAMGPHEIQIGLLKRLRGTAVAREADGWGLVFSTAPPYEVLKTDHIDFQSMQRLRRFARYFDLVFNNGHFPSTASLLLHGKSPFERFLGFSDWMFATTGQSHQLALNRLARLLARYLATELVVSPEVVSNALQTDFRAAGREPIRLEIEPGCQPQSHSKDSLPERQRRHRDRET